MSPGKAKAPLSLEIASIAVLIASVAIAAAARSWRKRETERQIEQRVAEQLVQNNGNLHLEAQRADARASIYQQLAEELNYELDGPLEDEAVETSGVGPIESVTILKQTDDEEIRPPEDEE